MTVAGGMIALHDAIGDALTANTSLMGIVGAVYEGIQPNSVSLPQLIMGPCEPLYDNMECMGDAIGNRLRGIRITIFVMDDAPSKLRTLKALGHIETALDTTLSLSSGTACGKLDVYIRRAEYNEDVGLWQTNVDVEQLIDNI